MKTKIGSEGIVKVRRGTWITLSSKSSDAIEKLQALADKATLLTKTIRAHGYSLESQGVYGLINIAYKLANTLPSFKELPWDIKVTVTATASNRTVQSFKPSSPAHFRSLYLYPPCFTLEQNSEMFERQPPSGCYCYADLVRFIGQADLQSDALFTLKPPVSLTFSIPIKENAQRIDKLRRLADEGKISNEPILSWKDGKFKLHINVPKRPKLPTIKGLYEERNRLALIGVDLNSIHGVAVAHVSMTHTIEWIQVFKTNNPLLSEDLVR